MIKARPTEYRGVVYRSKSEAMFARYLDLRFVGECDFSATGDHHPTDHRPCSSSSGWIYEPIGFEVHGWTPDFLVHAVGHHHLHGAEIPNLHYWLLEYKPSAPTKTYMAECSQRFQVIHDRFDDQGLFEFSRRCTFMLYYGSVFTPARGLWEYCTTSKEWFDCDDDWIGDYAETIKETRFDLEVSHGI